MNLFHKTSMKTPAFSWKLQKNLIKFHNRSMKSRRKYLKNKCALKPMKKYTTTDGKLYKKLIDKIVRI